MSAQRGRLMKMAPRTQRATRAKALPRASAPSSQYLPGDVGKVVDRLVAHLRKAAADCEGGHMPAYARRYRLAAECADTEGRKIFEFIEASLIFAETTEVLLIADRLRERARTHWLATVEWGIGKPGAWRAQIRDKLAYIEPRAASLTSEQIETAYRYLGKRRERGKSIVTAEGLAAHLAVACGAFGATKYKPTKDAFAKLKRSRKRKGE